jgi:hypothetical protein
VSALKNVHVLNLASCCGLDGLSNLTIGCMLHTLDLSYSEIDDSTLSHCMFGRIGGNIHTLTLAGCNNITNVSPLIIGGNIHKLDLSYCKKLLDVSILSQSPSKIHTLNLSNTNIYDVSELALGDKNMHHLNLSNCEEIINLFGLGHGNIHTLDITGCNNIKYKKYLNCKYDLNRIQNLIY